MGFMDELRKLTQPYDDEDDFFEGADESFRPQQPAAQDDETAQPEKGFTAQTAAPQPVRKAQGQFQQGKSFFQQKPVPAQKAAESQGDQQEGLFGSFGKAKPAKAQRGMSFGGGREAQVILFSPKTFDEAGEIVNHILNSHSVVMTLEGIPTDTARRLLDFISGIAFALQGKITPVSAKTYFITPRNVDIIGAQNEQPESDGQYF